MPATFWVGGLALILATLAVLPALRRGPLALAAGLGLAGFAFNATLFPSLARIDHLWPAPRIAAIAAQYEGCALTGAGFSEPSMVFAMDAKVTLAAPEDLPALLDAPGCQLIAAPEAPPDSKDHLQEIGRITGIDLGNGRDLDFGLWLKP